MAKDLAFPDIPADAGNDNDFLKKPDTTPMVQPKNVQTGSSGGEWNIKGKLQVIDENGVVRLLMGFQKDGF